MTEPVAETPQSAQEQEEQRRREPIFNLPAIVVAFIVVCTGVHLVRLYLLDANQDFGLLLRTAFIPIRYSGQFPLDVYAFTTPVSYSLLHGSLTHLGINMIWLAAFGSPLANRLGAVRFVLFWVAASVGAAALHYLIHSTDQSPLVGASGAISGMMGAAARFGFRIDRSAGMAAFSGPVLPIAVVLRLRGVVTFLAIWMLVNLATGIFSGGPESESQIAWEAHIGGFLVGFFGIARFDRRIRR